MKQQNSLIITFVYCIGIMFLMMIGMAMEPVLDISRFSFIFINMMWFGICFLVAGIGIMLFFNILEKLPKMEE